MARQKNILSDELKAQLDRCKTQEDLFGKDGLAKELIGNMVTYMMEKELESKLGYPKNGRSEDSDENRRNGYNEKTVRSSSGDIQLRTPRDRAGEFEPELVKKYQKDNGLTEGERKLVTKVMKSKIVFSAEESAENLKKQEVKHIEKTIKESKAKKDFQKLITKIGQKLANEGQGNKIEKTAHKLAIKEIISSKNWEMSIPSIDRILTQTHDEESRQKLVDIKDKIHTVLEKKEKQSKQDTTYALKSQNSVLESNFQFEKNVIGFGGVLGQIYEDELVSSLEDTEEIIKVLDSKESLENQIIEDNTISTINTILEDEIIESLEEVDNITEEEETKIKDTREQQRKNAEENKSDNKSTKAKSVLKSLGNPDKGNSGNGNSGNGNSGNGNGKNK